MTKFTKFSKLTACIKTDDHARIERLVSAFEASNLINVTVSFRDGYQVIDGYYPSHLSKTEVKSRIQNEYGATIYEFEQLYG